MVTKKNICIFLVILLVAALTVVISSRAKLDTAVTIDGGQNVTLATPAPYEGSGVPTPPPTQSAPPLPQIDITSWEYVIANSENVLQSAPQVKEIGKTGAYFDTRAVTALNEMLAACEKAGFSPYVNLAYVPYSAQEYYFNEKVKEIAGSDKASQSQQDEAAQTVPRPGESDHQTGLAVDITDDFCQPYTDEQIKTEMLSWLKQNCAQYGFIQRYPAGKDGITGYTASFHFRYVGKEAAAYITANHLSLEEFVTLYK